MSRDLGIYGSPETPKKKKKDSGITMREAFCILVTMVVIVFSAGFILNIDSAREAYCNPAVHENTNVPEPMSAAPVQAYTGHGVREETVTTSVITSPYTWDYVMTGVMTTDSVRVSIHMGVTTQIKGGCAKLLLQNYGGNWFHTVFEEAFDIMVKSYVLEKGYTFQDLKYSSSYRQFENELRVGAILLVDSFSKELPLPIDIHSVKVISIE